ncbi:homeobox protein H2.0 [Drosophila busckii]|uniref:homeobox protein H2.0 n=1 Tax=Drosophila busckii TaxID=30019 RepID=UPI00083F301D|nr:homeobox protein H2.0 [Drosophila busckii]
MLLQDQSVNMEQSVPENLSTHVFNDCVLKSGHDPADSENGSNSLSDLSTKETCLSSNSPSSAFNPNTPNKTITNNTTKVKLSFSVDRLLSAERNDPLIPSPNATFAKQCCEGNIYACCSMSSCFGQTTEAAKHAPVGMPHGYPYAGYEKFYADPYVDYKSVLRPMPIRAAEHAAAAAAATFPTLATNALLRFHQQHLHPQHQPKPATMLPSALPLSSLKSLQLTQQQRFLGKAAQQQQQQQLMDIPNTATGGSAAAAAAAQNGGHSNNNNNNSSNHNSSSNNQSNSNNNNGKRKRSWSRAVFTNLQRKGLEIQFQQQKYITKPDRRKLAARLNLTDAQVKVWFQNRRMKWRHTRENLKSGQEKQPQQQLSSAATAAKPLLLMTAAGVTALRPQEQQHLDYSSDSSTSELSEHADDDDDNIEIDVVE